MINTTIVVGYLGFDPMFNDKSSTPVCSILVNTKRNFIKEGEPYAEQDTILCKSFGERAKMIAKNFKKGDIVVVEGNMQNAQEFEIVENEGTDKEKTRKVRTQELMISHIDGPFVYRDKKENGNKSGLNTPPAPAPASPKAALPTPKRTTPPTPPAPKRSTPPTPPTPPAPPKRPTPPAPPKAK